MGLQSSVPSRGVWGHQHGWPQMGEMVVSPTLPNRPKAPPRRPGRPHAQARHLHTHETIIASGSVTAGTGGVRNAWAVGARGGGRTNCRPAFVCLKVGFWWEMAAAVLPRGQTQVTAAGPPRGINTAWRPAHHAPL